MDTRLLRTLLPPDFDGDVDALWRAYSTDEADPNPYGFVTWLFHRGALPGKAARAALTSGRAVLTLSDGTQPLESSDEPMLEPLGIVGRGAMGEVLVVRDRALRRTLALKRTLAGAEASPAERAAFLAEAQITAQLDHPSIVSVHGFETSDDGAMAYTMQLVHGSTLEAVINAARAVSERPADSHIDRGLDARLRSFLSVCDAMAYAHEQGVVHRDLKPENIMVDRHGEVLVMDWGIARLVPAERGDEPLRIVGTPAYMSPEQAFGAPFALEPPSDQYSLGLILAEIVTLQRANPGHEPLDCIKAARKGLIVALKPPPGVPRVRRELVAIIRKATALKPSKRYDSVGEMAEDLRRFLRDEEVLAAPDVGLKRWERWVSHNRELALLLGLGLAGLLVLGGLGLTALGEARLAASERAAEARERALGRLAAITARQVRNLDEQMHTYEAVVAGITYAAEEALLRPGPAGQRYFGLDEGAEPPDLAPSAFYEADLSLTSIDLAIAAGVPREEVEDQLAQLNTLAPTLRAALARGSGARSDDDPIAALQGIRAQGRPLVWTYVATEAGVIVNFPGTTSGYPDEYDPRAQSWYEVALGTSGPVWNMLDVDESDMGLLLTAVEGLYSPAGEFLGVAALDVAFPYLIDTFLDAPELSEHVEAFLVDSAGKVVVRSSHRARAFSVEQYTQEAFEHRDALPEGDQRTAGWTRVESDGRSLQMLWHPLTAVDWTYVVVGERAPLFALVAEL